MADTLIELAERCEKATGPDRELDLDIGFAVDAGRCGYTDRLNDDGSWSRVNIIAPRYTASLDAAMTLVPEGYWHGYCSGDGNFHAHCFEQVVDSSFHRGKADTPALALCAAALRARAAVEAAA